MAIVAVKMMRAEERGDEEERKRFDREVRAVARLCHPNIASIQVLTRPPLRFETGKPPSEREAHAGRTH
jgi:serine/threonine protein kinase